MGGQQSTAGVIRQGTGAAPLSKQVTSEELQRAYEKGKEESSLMFQDTLDKVASQVYNNIHEQLQGIRNSEVERTGARVNRLTESMDQVRAKTNGGGALCADVELALAACLKVGKGDAAACAPSVSAYLQCARKEFESSKLFHE